MEIDQNFQLFFKTKSGLLINFNKELLLKLNQLDYSSLPEGTDISLGSGPFYELDFQDGSNLIINCYPIKCIFTISNSKKEISLYSLKHLKLILEKLKNEYTNPYFYSNYYLKDIQINSTEYSEIEFSYETEIEIKENNKDECIEKIKKIFKDIKDIYSTKHQNTKDFISPNFGIYFTKIIQDESNAKFDYIYSDKRKKLELDFTKFLNDDKEMIFPICGPHNIGKTITSLRIQKAWYLKGIKSLYLNIKYYFSEPLKDFDKKVDTLIKECFYFVENENQLIDLYNEFQKENTIEKIIMILRNNLTEKKFFTNKFFLIIDQYQEKYNLINILDLFSKFKIFLLSSINDTDVKENIILTYKEKSLKKYKLIEKKQVKKIIRYIYYEYLLDYNYYSFKMFEDLLNKKLKEKGIKSEENENKEIEEENKIIKKEIKEKLDFVSSILKQFNFFPKYFFGFIYIYETIFDLVFCEYNNIFLKLLCYELNKTIDIYKINDLLNGNNLIEKRDDQNHNYNALPEDKYIEYLRYVPLKYINFCLNGKGELYFYYSFLFFKSILKDFFEYCQAKDNFRTTSKGSQKGTFFEKIVLSQLRVFKKLNIDGHLEVNSIIDMDFTENYKLLEKDYIKTKKNILISQKNEQGKKFDFAIFKPKINSLMLFQSKYKIENKLIFEKKSYIESCFEVLENFKKSFVNNNIENVYLLYISSVEYNTIKKKHVSNLLKKNEINCLFYSVSDDYFSFNFQEKINELKCEDSYMILPEIKKYKIQGIKLEDNRNLESENEIKLLCKKFRRFYDNDKIYESLKNFLLTKKIKFQMGKLIQIDYFTVEEININKNKKYIVLFYLENEDDSLIDFTKPIGLIFYEKENLYCFELLKDKPDQTYQNYEELFEKFSAQSYYGIGEKA